MKKKTKKETKKEIRHRITIGKSPGDLEYEAKEFWDRFLNKKQIWTTLRLSYEQSYDYDPANFKKNVILHINNKPCSFMSSGYDSIVKPQLNWKRIMACFSDYKLIDEESFECKHIDEEPFKYDKIDEETIDFILLFLKPWPFREEFTHGYSELESLVQSTCAEINKVIKKLSPLAIQFNNIQFPHSDLLPIVGFDHIQCNYYLSLCREIVKIGKRIPDMHFRWFGIEKTKYKSPQSHSFWKYAVSGAFHEVNKYCHDECGRSRECTVDHEKTYRIIARLLNVLYPSIWADDLDRIANTIKSKRERLLRSLSSESA